MVNPANGIWSGPSIEPNTGIVDLTQLIPDSCYVYQYEIENTILSSCKDSIVSNLLYVG